MPYSVISYEPASLKKDDVDKAVLKLIGVEKEKVRKYIWVKNDKGKTVVEEDEGGNKKYDEVDGFCVYFKYKNKNNKWSGFIQEVELKDGDTANNYKSCLSLDLPFPKTFNSRSALVKFLQVLGIAEGEPELDEKELLSDTEATENNVDETSLMQDTDDTEDEMIDTPDFDEIQSDISKFKNRMFLAPFYLNSKGYAQLNKSFDLWELVKK